MTRRPPVLRPALKLFSPRLVFRQLALALLVFALYALWLRIPDASVIDVIGSAVLALVVLAVAGAGESALILGLVGVRCTKRRLLRGGLLLFAGVALWFGWSTLIDHIRGDDYLRAGYLNSRFPHQLRNIFSFEHILLGLRWMWTALAWLGAGAIGLVVFAAIASSQPGRAIVRTIRCLAYWAGVVVAALAAGLVTKYLIGWTPGHGLATELVSLVCRLSFAALVDAAAICLLLAILATCVRQADSDYKTPAGTPDEGQPRTVGNP